MKIRSKVTIGLISSALCVAALAHAASYKKTSAGTISFTTKAVAQMLTIEGTLPGVSDVRNEGGKLVLEADVSKLSIHEKDEKADDTDNARRDHALVTLKTKEHPKAKFVVAADSVSVGKGKKGTGTLTLGGKPHAKEFTYDAVEKDGKINVHAAFVVKLSEHGIEKPCKLGVCVSDDTEVEVNFSVAKE